MHEHKSLDLNWYLQFGITAFAVLIGLIYLVKNTASKYFVVDGDDDARFDSHSHSQSSSPTDSVLSPSSSSSSMPGFVAIGDSCVVCGSLTKKHCSRCKGVRYWDYGRTNYNCRNPPSSGPLSQPPPRAPGAQIATTADANLTTRSSNEIAYRGFSGQVSSAPRAEPQNYIVYGINHPKSKAK